MDVTVLGLFLLASFIGGVTTGLAGFALALVVSGIWLHIISPTQTVTLIVAYNLVTQSYAIWNLRHALDWRRVAPFIAGGSVGVPIGTVALTYVNPAYLRTGVGALLLLYSIYGLARPAFRPVQSGMSSDIGIGFFQRPAERADRTYGNHRHGLEPIARLAEGCATHCFPASEPCGHRSERSVSDYRRCRDGGND
jgi:uncharacterized membrane protein YfcA